MQNSEDRVLGIIFLCFPEELVISYFPPELGSAMGICDTVDNGLFDLKLDLVARMWPLDDSMFGDKCFFAELEVRPDQVATILRQ